MDVKIWALIVENSGTMDELKYSKHSPCLHETGNGTPNDKTNKKIS